MAMNGGTLHHLTAGIVLENSAWKKLFGIDARWDFVNFLYVMNACIG